ncbi:hypothetical protein [Actinocorallia sp. A-T 12471]|uniref:hypothetical protein n=1 Tax=Actinocorallia sp. A-T 12471 TaxID=3089813 RepID=UPI0029CB8A08|nr:hypothetical protein [Actinocorallia sp. A-T 12471]MDX6743846.1 hypothetical protein [Actinocorallia sp. A-T 12471]
MAAGALVGAWVLLTRWGAGWAAVLACVVAGLPLLGLVQTGVATNLYLRAFGERVEAVVVGVEHRTAKHGGYDVYEVADGAGHPIGGTVEGAADGLEPGAPLDVVVDPVSLLAPRLTTEVDERGYDVASAAAFTAWTLLVALALILGELNARRGTPVISGLRRFVPESVGVRAALITCGLAAVSLLEGWAIAAWPGAVAWILGVPLGLAALAAPFLLAVATEVKADGQQAWWPAWTALLFAGAVFVGGCVIPKDAYLNAFGERTTGVVGDVACEQTDSTDSGCYYTYRLTGPEGEPLNGTLGDVRLYDPGTELPILADPRGDIPPQLITDDRADFGYPLAALGLAAFAATATAATLRHHTQRPTTSRPTPTPHPHLRAPDPQPDRNTPNH